MSKKEAFSIPGIDPALELAAQSSNDFFYVVFENGEILFANSPACDLIGKAPKKLSDVFDEDAGFRGQFLFEKAKKKAKVSRFARLKSKSGTVCVEMSLIWLGRDKGFLCVGKNIIKANRNKYRAKELERKYKLQSFELKQSNAKYKEAQKIGKIGNWHWDIGTNTFTWSDQMYEIFPRDKKLGPPSLEEHEATIHPEEVHLWRGEVEHCLSSREPFERQTRVLCPDGKTRHVKTIGKPLYDERGRLSAYFGTSQDVTAENELAREREFVLNSMKVGVWKWDVVRNTLVWDDSMFDLYGMEKGPLSRGYEEWEERIHPDHRRRILKEFSEALESKKEFDFTFEILTPTQESKVLGAKGKIERNNQGKPLFVYGINYDKTAEALLDRKLEEEKIKMIHSSKLATIGEMAAGIAHEINNPLAIISGCASVITHDKIEKSPVLVKNNLEKIQNAVERISRIVSGLREFARQSEGVSRRKVTASSILEETLELTSTKAKRSQVELMVGAFKDFEIFCDEIQIQQILINLINNAIDAAEKNPKKWVKVNAWKGEHQIFFRIQDSGEGIRGQAKEKLFSPFFTTKEIGKGTGLGLSVSRKIAREHGGDICYKVLKGQTCFELVLPCGEAKKQAA